MKKLLAFLLAFAPSFAFAQPLNDINSVAQKATNIGNLFIELCIAFAVIWIIFSVVRFFIAGGEDDREKGKQSVIYGVIGLFLILSIWGLVYLLTNTFQFGRKNINQNDLNNIKIVTPPTVPN